MFCTECGHKIEYTDKKPNFCPSCGHGFATMNATKKKVVEQKQEEVEEKEELEWQGRPKINIDARFRTDLKTILFQEPMGTKRHVEALGKNEAKESVKQMFKDLAKPARVILEDNEDIISE